MEAMKYTEVSVEFLYKCNPLIYRFYTDVGSLMFFYIITNNHKCKLSVLETFVQSSIIVIRIAWFHETDT